MFCIIGSKFWKDDSSLIIGGAALLRFLEMPDIVYPDAK